MKESNQKDTGMIYKPRQNLQSLLFACCVIWQTIPACLGLVIFMVTRWLKLTWKMMLPLGICLAIIAGYFEYQDAHLSTFIELVQHGWHLNFIFWKRLLLHQQGLLFLYHHSFNFLVGASLLLAGLLSLLELVPNTAHEKMLRQIQLGKSTEKRLINEKTMQKKLKSIGSGTAGTVLGLSLKTGQPIEVSDQAVNQVVLVLGTTGGGKSVTLRRFYDRAAQQANPLIIVDAKPDDSQINWVMDLAKKFNRPFFGFNCGNCLSYNVLAEGGYTELKDKIICLKNEWSSDYYRSIAEDYLQTVFELLLASGKPFDLGRVITLFDFNELSVLARSLNRPELTNRVKSLADYKGEDLKGLRAHFQQLMHSELGRNLLQSDTMFSLRDVINQNGIVYFALPALKYPAFAAMLGKLVINDIKTVIERGVDGKKLFTVFDEFSVFAGEQVLNLVNMGRGKGVHAIFGTQGIGDLDQVSPQFTNQVLNCVNTLISHRVNDQNSAEVISIWSGTKEVFDVTAQITVDRNVGVGSVKKIKEFVVHPDLLKQELLAGEAVFISKFGGFHCDTVRVKYS